MGSTGTQLPSGNGDRVAARTVVFDVGMTLLRAEPSYADVFVTACSRAGLDLGHLDTESIIEVLGDAWRAHDDAWRDAGHASPHLGDDAVERRFWTGLYRRILGAIDVPGDHGQVAAKVFETFLESASFGPFDDVVDTLDALERHDVTLGILSNWGRVLRRMLEDHGLAPRFDAIVVSGEEGVAKPDPEIFHRALGRLGEEPGPHVVYVGDDVRHDIEPATALGLTAVLVDRYDWYPEHDGPRVTDLRELPALLDLST